MWTGEIFTKMKITNPCIDRCIENVRCTRKPTVSIHTYFLFSRIIAHKLTFNTYEHSLKLSPLRMSLPMHSLIDFPSTHIHSAAIHMIHNWKRLEKWWWTMSHQYTLARIHPIRRPREKFSFENHKHQQRLRKTMCEREYDWHWHVGVRDREYNSTFS